MFLHGVMVTQRALNSLSLVRFQLGVPNKNILTSIVAILLGYRIFVGSIPTTRFVSVFLFGNSFNKETL
jgi:hypothetical protein